MITIQHCTVTIMVSNLEKSIDFYTNLLGLSLRKRYGNHYAEIEAPGLLIGLNPTDRKIMAGDGIFIGLGVPDLNLAKKDFEAKGINFQLKTDGPVQLAYFTDPDQNQLYLATYSAP